VISFIQPYRRCNDLSLRKMKCKISSMQMGHAMPDTKVLCTSCDIYCSLLADVEDGRVVRVRATDPRPCLARRTGSVVTGTLSDAPTLSDAQLCPDDPDYLDAKQGIPHMKGIPCRIEPIQLTKVKIAICSTPKSPLSFETICKLGSVST
jgi:hypothetical protein